jgi:hypothetical protein
LEVGHKANDFVKKILLRNPKKRKPDAIWKNVLRKAVAQKRAVLPMMIMMMMI